MIKLRTTTILIIPLLVAGWILLLLPAISPPSFTPPAQNTIHFARLVFDGKEAHFGSFGYNSVSDFTGRYFNRGTPPGLRQLGYTCTLLMPWAYPDGVGEEGEVRRPFSLVQSGDTKPFVLFPITLAVLGLVLITFVAGAVTANTICLVLSGFLGVVASVVAWAAWSYANRLTAKIERRLSGYQANPYAMWEVSVERGMAVWLGLAGAILVTLATILIFVRIIRRSGRNREAEEQRMAESTYGLGGLKPKDTADTLE